MSKASEWAKSERVRLSNRKSAIAISGGKPEIEVVLCGRFWEFTLTADEAIALAYWIRETFVDQP